MKAFIGFSSGQDGVLALYKTLTETDYDVYAINIHATAFATDDTKEKHFKKYKQIFFEIYQNKVLHF